MDMAVFAARFPFSCMARDSLDEALEARLTRLTSHLGMGSESALRGPLFRLGYSFAVALLLALVVMPTVHRRQVQAEAQIAANAVPIPNDEILSDELVDEPEGADRATGTGLPVHTSDTLAQADRVQTAEASTAGQTRAQCQTARDRGRSASGF